MSDLSVLIRLHQHELDEKRRALADLYQELAELEKRRRQLERDFEREKETLAKADDIHFTFANYAETVIKRRDELNQSEAALEQRIQTAKFSLLETFSELKKFEMTQDQRDRLEAEERLFRENQELDGIALEGFRRKTDD